MESISIAKNNYITAKTIQTRNGNRSQRPTYRVGDIVMLDSSNICRHIKKEWSSGQALSTLPRPIHDYLI
jgi:hypothetical protein